MNFKRKHLITISSILFFGLLIVLLFSFINPSSFKNNSSHFQGKNKKPKNIILMIGDGMGVSQLYAGLTANGGKLNLERCTYSGFSKTHSIDDYITDSAAGATALSTGTKTKNGYVGVDSTGKRLKTILEIAEDNGLATGLVATSSITHATPVSFIAHHPDRGEYEKLAKFFLETEIDVFIGGGKSNFNKRKDSLNLISELEKKNYVVTDSLEELINIKRGKLAGFVASGHPKSIIDGRGDLLNRGTNTALNILKQNSKGFFLMIEASQIDWGGHDKNTEYVVSEMLDFDKVIGKVLDFAKADGNTLVIITADHETGGMIVKDGNFKTGDLDAVFTTTHHTGIMVPVFSFGPGADEFSGIIENTDIFFKMKDLFQF